MEKFPKPIQHAAEYALEDDSIPKFTVWSFGSKTNKIGHFGNSEQTIVDWLLYLYTEPFSVVVDPFAGGGLSSYSKYVALTRKGLSKSFHIQS